MAVVIKTFSTPGGLYVYDRGANAILSVSSAEHLALQRIEAGIADNNDCELLKRYIDQGYLQDSRIKEIEHPATTYMPFYLENCMNQLTLQVTQDCNLRCNYCIYGGMYGTQRIHSKKTMSFEMMKKCVDFIIARSRGVDEICVSFYGGESFLEIDKIKACVSYIKDKYKGRSVRYTTTTNGTLFNDEIIRFLDENGFATVISIDGPRDLHNKNRVYANGRGSYDDIMENVQYIKKHYPKYYEKLSFTTVIAPGIDFSCVSDFFSAEEILSDSNVNYSTVNKYGASNDLEYNDLYYTTRNYQMMKSLFAKIGLYSIKKTSKFFATSLADIEILYANLSKTSVLEKSHPGGPCLPGAMRPFADVDGNLFPCERVSEGSIAMNIGHVDTGFDLKKIEDILNVGRLTEAECKSCWCFNFCGLCAAACDRNGKLCGEERLRHCYSEKYSSLDKLVAICLLLENKHDFNKFKDGEGKNYG